jgi:hypothetical protein
VVTKQKGGTAGVPMDAPEGYVCQDGAEVAGSFKSAEASRGRAGNRKAEEDVENKTGKAAENEGMEAKTKGPKKDTKKDGKSDRNTKLINADAHTDSDFGGGFSRNLRGAFI